MSDKVIYTVGGTVQAGGGIYISRDADEELLRLCRAGEFCYVLTARQTGKSSLMVATRERLAAEDIRSVEIDLTKMGSELSGLTAEQWYLGLIDLIVDQLDLDVDYVAWWDERAHLGPTQRLSQFLRQVVLEWVSEPVVIFIDEIDSTLNLDFTDDFFAAIRACYNARASDPVFKRLSFVLLGVATPGDLISDPQRTPFNIGRWMDLTDFTERQAIPLAAGLDLPPVEADQILTWILGWTGGHPYLTQRLCAAAAASPTKNWDAATVDKLVEETFFGERSAQDSNLRFVRDMLTQRAPDKAAVLKTYRRIHAGKAVPDEERSPIKTHLKLSGIVKAEDGTLHIRNEIYRRVFDLSWVRENTAVNWAPIVAGIAVFVALLAVGSILYNAWVGIQFQDCIANFYQTNVPEKRVAHLAKMFSLQGLFGPTDYDYQARELFYGLPRAEQLALFDVSNVVEDSDLIVLIKGLYITLADIDGTDSTRPLLEAMVQALDYLDGTEETNALENEINSWLQGRELAKQNQYADALAEYNKAIALNGENPATLYERARVLTELSEYQQALGDLDQVMAIARRAPAPTPTALPSSPSTTMPATLPTLTPTSTSTPSADITPTETFPSAGVTATSTSLPISTETPIPTNTPLPTNTPTPAPITSEFATIGQMISAVRNIIYGNPDLVSSLAGAPSSAYSNLREFGLVPTLTLTPTPTQMAVVISATDTPSPTMTATPEPSATNTSTIAPTIAVSLVAMAVETPTATNTPVPPTAAPTSTETPIPVPPSSPIPTPTSTLVPFSPVTEVQTLDEKRINSVAVDPTNSRVLYVAIQDEGLYKSTDGGASWRLVLDNPSSAHIAMDPTNPQVLYVGVWKGVCKTTDGGASWQISQEGLTAEATMKKVAVAPTNPQRVFAVSEFGISAESYKSDDGGVSWRSMGTMFPQEPTFYSLNNVVDLAVDPLDDDVIYVGGRTWSIGGKILEGGVLKTTDGGQSWSFAGMSDELKLHWPGRPVNRSALALVIDPMSPQIVYVTLDYGLFKSTNGGASWEYLEDLSGDPWLQGFQWIWKLRLNLFVHPLNPQVIFVGNGRVLRSTDGGTGWEEVLSNDFLRRGGEPYDYEKWRGQEFLYFASDFAFDHSDPQVIYASTWRGLLKSTDGGKTWDWM